MIHIGFTGTQRGMTGVQIRVVMQLLISLAATDVHHGDCIGSDDDFHLITSLWDTPVRRHHNPHRHPRRIHRTTSFWNMEHHPLRQKTPQTHHCRLPRRINQRGSK